MKKLSDILLITGLCIVAAGIIGGIVAGFVSLGESFNFAISTPVWMLSVIIGGGCVSVSGSVGKIENHKGNDFELLNDIIEKVKSEDV